MILLSVAHSKKAQGAYNEDMRVYEYELSQIMTEGCRKTLEANKISCDVLDVGKMKPYMVYKLNYVRRVNPELAVEIHLNSGSKTADYSMCIHYKDNERTKLCSQMILSNLKIGFERKGWHRMELLGVPTTREGFDNDRYSFVLKSPSPAIIVEPLFISNNEQCRYLLSDGALNAVGMLIGEAIVTWKKSLKS